MQNWKGIMNANDVTLKIDRARWWALREPDAVYHAQLMCGLSDVVGNPHGETACTDGRKIYWAPDYVAGQQDEELRFVLLHEAMHCALTHFARLPTDEDGQRAGDEAINHHLLETPMAQRGEIRMPKGAWATPRFKGMAEEEILAELRREKKQPKPGGENSSDGKDDEGRGGGSPQPQPQPDAGNCGGFVEGDEKGEGQAAKPQSGQCKGGKSNGNSPDLPPGHVPEPKAPNEEDSLSDQWERRVIQAAQAAKAAGRGDMPAELQRVLDKIAKQHIDWRSETADFLRTSLSTKPDWSRQARRHAWFPVSMPARKRDDVGLVLAARDTSGSVDDVVCGQFSALIDQTIDELRCRMVLVDCDAEIQAEYWLEPGMECPRRAEGGGGTSFEPIFERAKELEDKGQRISGIVILTDLDGSQPETSAWPVLWLSITDRIGKTGRTVLIE